jgi:hypothetical protein
MNTLQTFRGHIECLDGLPNALRYALQQYDEIRQQLGYDGAEAVLDMPTPYTDCHELMRLRRGFNHLTLHGVTCMARRHSHVCKAYVRQHSGDLMTLQGIFYWDGPQELRRAIIMNAWRKGISATQAAE